MEQSNQTREQMPKLRIRMLGDLQIESTDGRSLSFATRKAELLFCYLVLHPRRLFYRDTLVEKFFTDDPPQIGRKNLRTTIWQVRSVLEPDGIAQGTYLKVSNREVGYNANNPYWVDCQCLEGLCGSTSKQELSAAVNNYQGDFLEGFNDAWSVSERTRLKMLYLQAIELLMHHYARAKDWSNAITLGEKLIAEEPLMEQIYRQLMRYYYFLGDRPSALLKYQSCVKLLREELDVEPMAKTMKLFRDIKNESIVTEHEAAIVPSLNRVTDQTEDVSSLANQLREMDDKLALSLKLMEKLSNR